MDINHSKVSKELSKRKFRHFVKDFWAEVDSEKYIETWIHDCMCEHLQAVYEGDLKNLVINIPPGLGKSLICSVMFPAWVWANDPKMSFLCSTRDNGNLKRDSNKFYNLVNNKKYKSYFGNKFLVGRTASNEDGMKYSEDIKDINNNQKGYRKAVTTGSATTGKRGKINIVDDPNDRQDSYRKVERDRINDYVFKTLSTRNFAKLGGATIIIMQRLHHEDVAGLAIEKGYNQLCIPMQYDNKSIFSLPSWSDHRKEDEFINDKIFDLDSKNMMIKNLGSREFVTQYQQKPSLEEGSIIKREWVKYYEKDLNDAYRYVMSWDMAFKASDTSDYVVGQVWGKHPTEAKYYLVDQVKGKWDFPATIENFINFCKKWPKVTKKIVESKANGQAVIDTLKQHIEGITPYNPKDSKESRLNSIAPLFEAGNVYLPTGKHFTEDFVDELTNFPYHSHDDQVDACSQALLNFKSSQAAFAFVKSNNVLPFMN